MVCDATEAVPTFQVDGVAAPIVVCTTCGLGSFQPMLREDEIRALYPEDYYGEPGTKFRPLIEWMVRAVASRHISFLSRGVPPGGRILDVGCGRGVLFGPLADRGFAVYGMEMNESAVRGCDPRAEVRIAGDLSEARFEAGSFDQIVIWHVLEHLIDPRATIEECHRLLKPGGRLIVAVPNFSSAQARMSGADWFHLDPPRHLYHFPSEALVRLVERAGFGVESMHHFSLRQNPFGWIQSFQNRYSDHPPGALYTLLHHRGADRTTCFTARERLGMYLLLAFGAPVAIAASVAAAWLGTGATIHISAIRR